MERLLQDLRFAARILLKDRAFTSTVLLTLAVCIGANTAVFAVVNSVLLRPLSVPEPERLVLIYNSYSGAGVERAQNGIPDYFDRKREVDAFEELALYDTRGVTVGASGEPQRLTAMHATPSLLRILGAKPVQGRIFTEQEGQEGHDRKVVLTHGLWHQLYSGRHDVLGQSVRIDDEPYTIVGILPPEFHFVDPGVRLWIPMAFTPEEKSDDARHNNSWSMLGRLEPGATVSLAQQQIDALNARNMERFPQFREILTNAGFHTVATSFQEDLVRTIRGTLYLLWGGVLFVLLIGVVNITNLVLVRSSGRVKELATRHALGAGLTRLGRQLLTETVILTLAGATLGIVAGYFGVNALASLGLERLPRGTEVQLDGTVAAFTLTLALGIGCLVGLVPILGIRRVNLSQVFREEGRSGTAGRGARAVRRTLVASQVGFAFMLLIGAGLLLASFQRILAIDPGFRPTNVLTARVSTPPTRYADDAAVRTFADRFLDRVRALPGVQQAGITSNLPFGGSYNDSVILAEGYQMAPGESLISPSRISVTPGYFEALGIALVRGRVFNDSDTETSPSVVVIDEELARHFWGAADPVGRRMFKPDSAADMVKPGPNAQWYTVVGVVAEIRMSGLIETEERVGAYYHPFTQRPMPSMTLTARTAGDAVALTPVLRRELAALDPELPLYSVTTMDQRLSDSLIDRRTPMIVATTFALVALFLAAVGVYGVLAYQVSHRRREIGIRMALGSDASRVFRLVLSEGVMLLAAGLAIGLTGAYLIRRALESQLYGVGSMDPIVLGSVGLLLAIVALGACVIPARRAARIHPVIALTE